MKHNSPNRTLAALTFSTLLLGACGSGEPNDTTEIIFPLVADQPVYDSEDAANNRGNDYCSTLDQATEVPPAHVRNVGGWLVLKIATSDIRAELTDPAGCTGDFVYATIK